MINITGNSLLNGYEAFFPQKIVNYYDEYTSEEYLMTIPDIIIVWDYKNKRF